MCSSFGPRYSLHMQCGTSYTTIDSTTHCENCALVHWALSFSRSSVMKVCRIRCIISIDTYSFHAMRVKINTDDAFDLVPSLLFVLSRSFVSAGWRDLVAIVSCVCMNLHKCLLVLQRYVFSSMMSFNDEMSFSCAFCCWFVFFCIALTFKQQVHSFHRTW